MQVGNLMTQESAELGQQYLRERKAVQLGKRLFAENAGSRKESRYAAYSARLEVQDETAMECALGSQFLENVNSALHVHLMNRRRHYEKIGICNRYTGTWLYFLPDREIRRSWPC